MSASIHYDDLDEATKRQLGLKVRKPQRKLDHRGWALKILASMHKLTRKERETVLDFAIRINAI